MKLWRFLTLALAMLAPVLCSAQNWTTVTGTNVVTPGGQKVTGTLCFIATDANNNQINFRVGGGGQVIKKPACASVVNGAIQGTFQVANPQRTAPANIRYRIEVKEGTTLALQYTKVIFYGASFDFDSYVPSVNALPPVGVSVDDFSVRRIHILESCDGVGCGTGGGTGTAGVNTFNGRQGDVIPNVGDYSSFYSLTGHTHIKSNITDFPTTWDWSQIINKPSSFTPSAHTHGTADVISGTFNPARLPGLGANTLGAVKGDGTNTYCTTAGTIVKGFNTDGSLLCVADQTGGGGGGSGNILTINGSSVGDQLIQGGTNIGINTNTGTGVTTVSYTGGTPVNPDWNSSSGLSMILNKPTLFNGDYNTLTNKPTIPPAQVNADWNSVSGVSMILNKPTLGTAASKNVPASGNASATEVVLGADSRMTDARTPTAHTHVKANITDFPTLATVATTGSYPDLTNKPTIPTALSQLTNDAGYLVGPMPVHFTITYNGVIPTNTVFLLYKLGSTHPVVNIPTNCQGSTVVAKIAAAANSTFALLKNGVQFGSATVATGQTTATFTCSATTLSPTDTIEINGGGDAALATVGFDLAATY